MGVEGQGSLVAGTRVHTDRGLVAIEDLAIGDVVLSPSDSLGDLVHRRVIRKFAHPDRLLQRVSYLLEGKVIGVFVAVDQQILTEARGWVRAELLKPPGPKLVLMHREYVPCVENEAILKTAALGEGWVPRMRGDRLGTQLAFKPQMDVIASNVPWKRPQGAEPDLRLRLTTHGVEIENNAPFFIGAAGLTVRI